MILDLTFPFSHEVLEILDPFTATLPWDPKDFGSRTEKILLDPGDPGSSLEQVAVGACRSWILHKNNLAVF